VKIPDKRTAYRVDRIPGKRKRGGLQLRIAALGLVDGEGRG
jgi:hypothetical protein